MAHEILAQSYLIEDIRNAQEETFADQLNLPGGSSNPNYQRFMPFRRFHGNTINSLPPNTTADIPSEGAVVKYNYQHDLESLWWIAFYYITAGVGHIPSFKYAEKIFFNDLTLNICRSRALTGPVQSTLERELHPSLRAAFPEAMNTLRQDLYKQYIVRALFGQLNLAENYSEIHGNFATAFDKLLSDNTGNWKQTRLVPVKDTRAQIEKCLKRHREDILTLEEPVSNKRGKIDH